LLLDNSALGFIRKGGGLSPLETLAT